MGRWTNWKLDLRQKDTLRSMVWITMILFANMASICLFLSMAAKNWPLYHLDIIIIGDDKKGIKESKQYLFRHFQIKDLGQLRYFLEIEVVQSKTSMLFLKGNMPSYFERDRLLDCKLVDTPKTQMWSFYLIRVSLILT